MTTVLLVRHGLTAATGHTLSGWTPGIPLDDRGRAQARALAARLARLPLDAIVTSPLDRCRQTAEIIAAASGGGAPGQPGGGAGGEPGSAPGQPGSGAGGAAGIRVDERLGECRYGDWTGKPLRKLARDPLWRVVQAHPSAARFPGGESMLDTQHRAVAAVRDWNAALGPRATYLICSHGDVIKGIIADCLGLHLDQSQRIQADPCSLTVIRYTTLRPFLVRMNDTGGGVADLMPGPARRGTGRAGDSDAVVGGGAGVDPSGRREADPAGRGGQDPEQDTVQARGRAPAVPVRPADARG